MTSVERLSILLLDWSRANFALKDLSGWLSDPGSRIDLDRAEKMAALVPLTGRDNRRLFHLIDGLAVIAVCGPLFNDDLIDLSGGLSGYKGLSAQFQAALIDAEVRGVLFVIDSPGGVVNGCFDLVDEIFAGRGQGKPIWAVASDTATSAAYAIASACERVFLPRLGAVGSIGVLTLHLDMSRALDQQGVTPTLIFAGAHKVDGHPFGALPDDVRAEIQADVDHAHDLFVETVARNRGLNPDVVRATEGRIYDEREAVARGLVDAVATDKQVALALFEEVN